MIIRKLQDAGLYDTAGDVLIDYANELKSTTIKPPSQRMNNNEVKGQELTRPKFG